MGDIFDKVAGDGDIFDRVADTQKGDIFDKVAESPSIGAYLKTGASNLVRSFAGGLAELPEGIAIGADILDKNVLDLTPGDPALKDRLLTKVGSGIRSVAKLITPEPDPRLKDSFVAEDVPSAVGSAVSFLTGGGVGKAVIGGAGRKLALEAGATAATKLAARAAEAIPIAGLGAVTQANQAYKEALEAGANNDSAVKAYLLSLPIGATEVVPLGNMLRRLDRISGGGFTKALIMAGKETFEEAAQEAAQQFAGNAVARELYDKDRELSQGVLRGAAAGGITGFLLSTLTSAIGGRRPKAKQPEREQEFLPDQPPIEQGVADAKIPQPGAVAQVSETPKANVELPRVGQGESALPKTAGTPSPQEEGQPAKGQAVAREFTPAIKLNDGRVLVGKNHNVILDEHPEIEAEAHRIAFETGVAPKPPIRGFVENGKFKTFVEIAADRSAPAKKEVKPQGALRAVLKVGDEYLYGKTHSAAMMSAGPAKLEAAMNAFKDDATHLFEDEAGNRFTRAQVGGIHSQDLPQNKPVAPITKPAEISSKLVVPKGVAEFAGYEFDDPARPTFKVPGARPGWFSNVSAPTAVERGYTVPEKFPSFEEWKDGTTKSAPVSSSVVVEPTAPVVAQKTESLFRETTAQEVDSYVNPATSARVPFGVPEVHASTTRDLALGQGRNKTGIVVEFDPTNLDVAEPRTQKPGAAFVEQRGGGVERIIRGQAPDVGKSVRSITIPNGKSRDPYVIRLRRYLSNNWTPENTVDSTVYRPKESVTPEKTTQTELPRVRLKGSPQTYRLVEHLPQSELEKSLGEQPVRIRNERTGKEETALEDETEPVRETADVPKKERISSAELDKQLQASGMDPSVFPTAKSKREALKRAKAKPSDIAKSIADKLEGLKSGRKSGDLQLFGVVPAIWDKAIEIAQGVIRAGGTAADAVAKAIDYIKKNYRQPWDEAGATAALTGITSVTEPRRASIDDVDAQESAADEQAIRGGAAFKANVDLADELEAIEAETDEKRVKTKVGNVHDQVLSRPGLGNAVKQDSVDTAQKAFAEAGLTVTRNDDGLFQLTDESTSQEEAGEKFLGILEREVNAAEKENRPERIANLLNTTVVHLARDKNAAFSQSLKNRLYDLAQGERSKFGRALGSLAMWGKVLANIAQNPSVHLHRIYSDFVGGTEVDSVIKKIKKAIDTAGEEEAETEPAAGEPKPKKKRKKPSPDEITTALKKVKAELTPQERKAISYSTLWQKIERWARSGLFDENMVLEEIAKARGWAVPSEAEKAQMRKWAAEEQSLRQPSKRQIENAKGDIAKATTEAERGTESERLALIKKMQATWSLWSMPTSWNPLKWGNPQILRNNAKAVNEFVAANLLFKFGFVTRQFIDVAAVSMPLNAANRSIAHAIQRMEKEGFSSDSVNELGQATKEMVIARISSLKATLRDMERVATGQTNRKVLERMTNSIGIFERMRIKADSIEKDKPALAMALRLMTIMQAGYRVAAVFDSAQTVGLEWQEMRQQLSTDLRAQGKNRAEIAMVLDDIFGGIKVDMLQAVEEVRAIKNERGLKIEESAVQQDAWALIKARAYDRMKLATNGKTDYQTENEVLRELHAWNLPEQGGIGGMIAETIKGIRNRSEKMGIPTGGLFSFGNAMGIAANRMATFSGLGLFGGWGFGESPWYQGARNIQQRRIEAIQGLAAIGIMTALATAGRIAVQVKYPDDKDEKEKFIAAGHKLNTVRFIEENGDWKEYPIQMSPFSFIAAPLYMIGGVQRLITRQQREQDKLNKEAEKTGATPGKAKAIGLGDVAGVVAQGLYGTLTGGRTASGAVQSFSDYGDFNLNKATAALVGPYVPAVPMWQETARMMGVAIDTRTAPLLELLVPLPGSQNQRVNALGDPLVNPNSAKRVLQVLTGGVGFGTDTDLPSDHAYRQIFAAGYSVPDVGRSKGYNFDGVIRPMSPKELEQYTVARGKAFKQQLDGVSVEGLPEDEAKKQVRAAFQRANSEALSSVGVTQTRPVAQTRSSGRPATRAVAPSAAPVSRVSAGSAAGASYGGRSRRLSRGLRLRRGGVRRGRSLRGSRIRRQPSIRGLRRGRRRLRR